VEVLYSLAHRKNQTGRNDDAIAVHKAVAHHRQRLPNSEIRLETFAQTPCGPACLHKTQNVLQERVGGRGAGYLTGRHGGRQREVILVVPHRSQKITPSNHVLVEVAGGQRQTTPIRAPAQGVGVLVAGSRAVLYGEVIGAKPNLPPEHSGTRDVRKALAKHSYRGQVIHTNMETAPCDLRMESLYSDDQTELLPIKLAIPALGVRKPSRRVPVRDRPFGTVRHYMAQNASARQWRRVNRQGKRQLGYIMCQHTVAAQQLFSCNKSPLFHVGPAPLCVLPQEHIQRRADVGAVLQKLS